MNATKKFFVTKLQSSKDNTKTFPVLQCDLGYRVITVSFDTAVIAEVSGLTFENIYNLKVNERIDL